MSASCLHKLSDSRLRPSAFRGGQLSQQARLLQVPISRPCSARPSRRSITPCAYFTVKGPGPKGGAKQAYICKDCGYIYDGKQDFESLSKDYECPVCAAPKRRFKTFDKPVERNANATANRKARKETLQSGPDATQLVIFLLGGAVVLVGLYAVLNATY